MIEMISLEEVVWRAIWVRLWFATVAITVAEAAEVVTE